jgi:zinc protease
MTRLRALCASAATLLPILLALVGSGCHSLAPPPAWEQPPPVPVDHAIVSPEDLHRTTLANGIELILLEDRRLPRISMGFTLRRGAGSVDAAASGVAELATEVMQRGAGDRDALALARVVEDAGATLSASAGWDTTDLAVSGLSEDRGLLFEILADVALRPRFDPVEFEKARSEQLAAIVSALDDPATLVQWYALDALYDGHRYGTPLSGTAETLATIDVEQARAYWTDRFVPRNTVFWAVGDFDSQALIERVRRTFGALADGPVPGGTPPPPSPTPKQRRIVVVDKPGLAQAQIILGHEGIARTEPTRIAVDIMNDALGGSGFSSRLMQSVRSNEGLTYGIGSGFSLRSEPGPFSVSTFTRVPMVRRVVDLVLEELEAIRGPRPVGPEELDKFIGYNVGRFGLSLETSDAVLASLVDLEVHGLPDDSLDTYRARVRAVTVDDVAEAARRRLHPERVAIVILGPAEAIVPQLEDLGGIEVLDP